MEWWQQIINTAILGTDKLQGSLQQVPTAIAEASAQLQQSAADREEQFLQLAALSFNYRQCGALPLHKEGTLISKAADEELAYCSATASQVLKDILFEENIPLLQYWLQLCAKHHQIVIPDVAPALLQLGKQHKQLQALLSPCLGKRGEWLTKLNPEWNFSINVAEEDMWQLGSPEQRKTALLQKRKQDPAVASEWLQQTWQQEDANTKTDLLQLLTENISAADIPFLESLANEKSKKVKDLAIKLLRLIPESSIVQLYQQALQQTLVLKKEKTMLGLSSKTTLHLQLPLNLDEQVYKSGIEKLSNNRDLDDDQYIVYQLLQSVPPGFLETYWQLTPEEIIGLFKKELLGHVLFPALVTATVTFRDTRWAQALVQFSEIFYLDILPLLNKQQQELYSLKFIDKHPDIIIKNAIQQQTEWSVDLTTSIFRQTARVPYQYNKSFYNNNILLFPVDITGILDQMASDADHYAVATWDNTQENISRLLELKKQTKQAFN